jgi:hypothetical protein
MPHRCGTQRIQIFGIAHRCFARRHPAREISRVAQDNDEMRGSISRVFRRGSARGVEMIVAGGSNKNLIEVDAAN